jgi:transposase-like protein
MDLHDRSAEEPLLLILDDILGIGEEIKQLHPRADFSCHWHASWNIESLVRVQDHNEIDSYLKGIFLSKTREEAYDQFAEF